MAHPPSFRSLHLHSSRPSSLPIPSPIYTPSSFHSHPLTLAPFTHLSSFHPNHSNHLFFTTCRSFTHTTHTTSFHHLVLLATPPTEPLFHHLHSLTRLFSIPSPHVPLVDISLDFAAIPVGGTICRSISM